MVTLLPLSPPEFDDYLNHSIRNYAAEKVRAGTWTEAGADVLSKEAFDQLLPQGLDTEHQHLYSIVDEASRNKVGMVWIGVKDRSPVPGAWIWDIIIYEQYRRRGYATVGDTPGASLMNSTGNACFSRPSEDMSWSRTKTPWKPNSSSMPATMTLLAL